ncbi:MAG: hypothetical protein ACYDGW_08935 [Vulcanimicrobiaceae bacterium]
MARSHGIVARVDPAEDRHPALLHGDLRRSHVERASAFCAPTAACPTSSEKIP